MIHDIHNYQWYDLRQEHLARAKEVSHDIHAVHEGSLNHLQGLVILPTCPSLLSILSRSIKHVSTTHHVVVDHNRCSAVNCCDTASDVQRQACKDLEESHAAAVKSPQVRCHRLSAPCQYAKKVKVV